MSYLAITHEGVEAAALENNDIGRLARAIRPEISRLTGENGRQIYSIHTLCSGKFHIDRKSSDRIPLEEVSSIVNKRYMDYANFAEPLIQEMVHVLDCDLQHAIDAKGNVNYNLEALIAWPYYNDNLNCLDGYRIEAVSSLNSKLREYKVPEQYRFD